MLTEGNLPHSARPIAVTPGEPAGIGPDVVLQHLARHLASHIGRDTVEQAAPLVIIADPQLLSERAEQLNLPIELQTLPTYVPNSATQQPISVLPVPCAVPSLPGQLNADNASYVLATLEQAIQGCLAQEFSALVTGPVHKGVINQAGHAFTGHTELLAKRCGAPLPVMMLATDQLRVLLATTHIPLKAVADTISEALVTQIAQIALEDLQHKFGLKNPHLMICGLNPHAGEDGHLGDEEITAIQPAIYALQQQGYHVSGPWPADTAFAEHHLNQADAVLAMYHDQGLPVLKHHGFGRAANITLGLPIIRTSVDHGTALDLAGTGQAHTGSFATALHQAGVMLQHLG